MYVCKHAGADSGWTRLVLRTVLPVGRLDRRFTMTKVMGPHCSLALAARPGRSVVTYETIVSTVTVTVRRMVERIGGTSVSITLNYN